MEGPLPLVSVIVPVYNAEKYLERCLRSLIGQTYVRWELLLIDDGSTDKSTSICDTYAVNDNRVRVFHIKNKGVSHARNYGLGLSSGEWVTFVDADDWVKPTYLEHLLYPVFKESDIDVVISFPEIHQDAKISRPKLYPQGLVERSDFTQLFTLYDLDKYTQCWGKLYRKSMVLSKRLCFPEGMSMGEDHVFLYACVLASYRLFVVNNVDYCYRRVSWSLSWRYYSLPMEVKGYHCIHDVVNLTIRELQIADPIALSRLRALSGYYLWRVLEVLYNPLPSRKIRMSVLRDLDMSVIVYAPIDTCKARFLAFLLHKGWLSFYDMVRCERQLLKNFMRKFFDWRIR